MSERSQAGWSWRPRISLRNWILLILAAGLGSAWYFQTEPVGKSMPGSFRLAFQETKIQLEKDNFRVVVHGPIQIRDADGRLVARGEFDLGTAVGDWAYYHPNRTLRFSGPVQNGQRSGTWLARDRRGDQRGEINHGEPRPTTLTKPADSQYAKRTLPSSGARRRGAAWISGAVGRPGVSGQFDDDHPTGKWAYTPRSSHVERGENTNGVRHGTWQMPEGGECFAYGHSVAEPEQAAGLFIEQLARDERRRWLRAIRGLVALGAHGSHGLTLALQSPDRDKQLAALAYLAVGQPLDASVSQQVQDLAAGQDAELACHAELTLALAATVPSAVSLRRVLSQMITARHAVPSLLPRLGTHHEALMPGLLALLEDHDPRIRRLSLDLIAGVIARVRFDYSWAQPGGILWRETEKAVRNATHSDDEVLAAAAQLVLTEYFSPGNRHRSLPALF